MEQNHIHSRHGAFKVYISILLTFITILLAVIVAFLVYAGLQLKNESKAVNATIGGFSKQIDTMNSNLENLKQNTQSLPGGYSF